MGVAMVWFSFSIFIRITAAAAAASVALLLVGTWILVVLHVLVVAKVFLRHYTSSSVGGAGSSSNGLSAEELEKLPCFLFHDSDDLRRRFLRDSGADDCAVCLERFRRGEKCRMLPACTHSFHARCVDAWLLMTPLCPICRTIAAAAAAAAIP